MFEVIVRLVYVSDRFLTRSLDAWDFQVFAWEVFRKLTVHRNRFSYISESIFIVFRGLGSRFSGLLGHENKLDN